MHLIAFPWPVGGETRKYIFSQSESNSAYCEVKMSLELPGSGLSRDMSVTSCGEIEWPS